MIETAWKGAALASSNQVVRGDGLISHVPFFEYVTVPCCAVSG